MTGTAHGRGSHSDVLETLGRRIATGELPEGRILTLADLELEPGFEVQLVAAEPDVVDPVALVFDENGAMWVVEMRG